MAQFAGEFPKTKLDDALEHLRRPFTERAVKFKIQSAWKKEGSAGAFIVTYIDARLVSERLNHVVGEAWEDNYADGKTPNSEVCLLTVLGVTRQDVGEASGIALQKALKSDALKRAAVKFGVGVSVYAVPAIMLNPNDGLRPISVKGKDSFALKPEGEEKCRKLYATWLKDHGEAVFGDPLDHGDTEGAQGDYEIERVAVEADVDDEPVAAQPTGGEQALTPAQVEVLRGKVKDAGRDLMVLMGAVGIETEDELTNVKGWEILELIGVHKPAPAARQPRARARGAKS